MHPSDAYYSTRYSRGIWWLPTRHNSADSVPTSNLVCIKEVAIRTYFSHVINIARIIYCTCSLVIDIQRISYKNAFNKRIVCQNNFSKLYSE